MVNWRIISVLALVLQVRGDVRAPIASWYGAWHEGRPMADGCPFHARTLVAASRTLPLGSWLRVRNRRNGRSVIVQVRDRGPYVAGRALDLSLAAAEQLDMVAAGLAPVDIEVLMVAPPGACLRV